MTQALSRMISASEAPRPRHGQRAFLVIAFGLLTAMYREEAKHRGDTISDRAIAESILENNLFGIDIDPRAIRDRSGSSLPERPSRFQEDAHGLRA